MEIYPTCILCDKKLADEEKEKNMKHKNFLHPLCNDCLKTITGNVTKTFEKKK